MSPALVVFSSCQTSYPFHERHVYVREPVKIGRTVGRSRPAQNNATFHCKVLSRNHALLWFDHKSSKQAAEPSGGGEPPPSQIFTDDIIQFGVDVTESNHNVTHGCVVSLIRLILPDNVEACHRSDGSPAPSPLPVERNQSEDRVPELVDLQKDTHTYETTAKEALRRVLQEKVHLGQTLRQVELNISSTEDTCSHLQHLRECAEWELTELSNKYNTALAEKQQEEQKEREELQLLIHNIEEQQQVLQTNRRTKLHLPSLQESQLDAAGCLVSGTLGLGKDHANHSTVSRMEEKKNETVNNVTLHTEDSGSGELRCSEAEPDARLSAQLHEAQDAAASSQRRCVELQAQVQKLQEEVKMLCAERECIVSSAQEEVLLLRGTMEASASEWENERASLQEDLGVVTAELDRWRRSAAEYKQETASLKARLQELIQQSAQTAQLQGELQKNCTVLQTDCAALRSEKTTLQEIMQHLEKELYSSRDQSALLGRSVSVLERTQGELESRLAEQQELHRQDCVRLKAQIDQATHRIKGLQREYEETQVELVQVKRRCSEVEQEKLSLSEELQQCKDKLRQLQERASRYEDTQVELVQVKRRCSEVEQEKLSLSEELQQCKDKLRQLQERASRYEETQVELVQVKRRCSEVEQEKLSLSEELQQCKDKLRQLQERASRYEDTQVELVQVKRRCSEVEQEKLSLSEELQQCKDKLRQLQERASRLPVVDAEWVAFLGLCCCCDGCRGPAVHHPARELLLIPQSPVP
ncbi:hypothetical protein SKAU_G00422460 [Synaphobranchus kaupii]|uniref:FHA domain-containing protein n=1 Tax=Synaphobranchus kaupii TaxID=118154 RepID=A0A9Q1E6Y5_SYNKA|nr:hypothetical protein SKAU_G00422460 [Synaphobranchus kaupii]